MFHTTREFTAIILEDQLHKFVNHSGKLMKSWPLKSRVRDEQPGISWAPKNDWEVARFRKSTSYLHLFELVRCGLPKLLRISGQIQLRLYKRNTSLSADCQTDSASEWGSWIVQKFNLTIIFSTIPLQGNQNRSRNLNLNKFTAFHRQGRSACYSRVRSFWYRSSDGGLGHSPTRSVGSAFPGEWERTCYLLI